MKDEERRLKDEELKTYLDEILKELKHISGLLECIRTK